MVAPPGHDTTSFPVHRGPVRVDPVTGRLGLFGVLESAMPLDESGGSGGGGQARNVLGGKLEICSLAPMTGFFRDGCCNTSAEDVGSHTVCVVMTADFLKFSAARGNDLSTPMPDYGFPGLKPGDRWCLCAPPCQEAFDPAMAPPPVPPATPPAPLASCHLPPPKTLPHPLP